MHGRPRKSAKAEDAAASAAKAEKPRALQSQLLHNHRHRIYTEEALEISSKLLEVNPEVYTAWNYRKLAVQSNLESSTDPNAIKTILDQELRVAEVALRLNPKCYGAWHHRKWVMRRGFSSVDDDREFRLLDQLLKADSRNFHGWNHRRFVATLKNVSEEDELKFTTDKINSNFSNYSAWHSRSVLLSRLLEQKVPGFVPREKVLTEEFELIHQALFTDPDDQSGWFYHLWLLDQTITPDAPSLISSWPTPGSEIVLSSNRNMDDCNSFPSASYYLYTGVFPIVLYFNQVVKGVNSSTVTVKSVFNKNKDLIWKPLSSSNSEEAHCWVTYLKIPDEKPEDLKTYSVEVVLGDSLGIISSSVSHSCHSSRFGFVLDLRSPRAPQNEGEFEKKMVVWDSDNFSSSGAFLEDNTIALPFQQLRISNDHEPSASKWPLETLCNEISLFRVLLLEINCKIAKLTLARLLIAHDGMMTRGMLSPQRKTHTEEVLQLYDDLMKLDPLHIRYYMDGRSLVLLDEVTSDKESFAKHCFQEKRLTSSSFHHQMCVQLKKLSLTRVGFVERLLWVQMLDLSNNELCSIEGLEAMQLLSCLNLCNNKISSFTALEPLKFMNSLKVLDISYNEIGAHPIDTTRYLCASPLSHSPESVCNVKEYGNCNLKVSDYWEPILLFKDLHLKQLNVMGNPIASENFRELLIRLLPTLKWLDGQCV